MLNKTINRDLKCEIYRNNFDLTAIVIAKCSEDSYQAFQQLSRFSNVTLLPIDKLNKNADSQRKRSSVEMLPSHNNDNSIKLLNDSCLLKIFSYLNTQTLFELGSVCTQFQNVVRMDVRIKKIKKYHFIFGGESTPICCLRYRKRIGEVKEMERILNCIGIYVNEIVLELPQPQPNSRYKFNEFLIVDTMIRNVKANLRTVHFKYFRWLTIIFEHLLSPNHMAVIRSNRSRRNNRTTFPNLKALSLYDNGRPVNGTNISELHLEHSRQCNWGRFLQFASINTPNMTKLVMPNETLASNQFVYLLNLKNLRKLEINVGDFECFDILLQLTELTRLSIVLPENLKMGHRYVELARHMRDLEHFRLKEVVQSSARDFFEFISQATTLQSFHIEHLGSPTDVDYVLLNGILVGRKKSQIKVADRTRLQFSIHHSRMFANAIKVFQ